MPKARFETAVKVPLPRMSGMLAVRDVVSGTSSSTPSLHRTVPVSPLAAGAVTVQVAPAGEQLWRTRPFSGLSSAVMTLQAQLNRASSPGDSDWVLDEQTYNAAVREYALRLADGR